MTRLTARPAFASLPSPIDAEDVDRPTSGSAAAERAGETRVNAARLAGRLGLGHGEACVQHYMDAASTPRFTSATRAARCSAVDS